MVTVLVGRAVVVRIVVVLAVVDGVVLPEELVVTVVVEETSVWLHRPQMNVAN